MAGDLPAGFSLDEPTSSPAVDLPQGFQLDDDQAAVDRYQKLQETHGGLGQQVKAGLEGAASAATFGLSTGLETALGVDPADIRARREANPGSHMLGQGAGLIGTALIPGLGEANALKVMGAAGSGVTRAVGLGAAESLGAKIGAGAVNAAVENALFQSGDEISKMLSEDPHQSVETAAANIGLSGLVGGVVGGGIGALNPLWKATVGDRGAQFIEDFKGRINEHRLNPEPVQSLTKELDDLYHSTKSAADEVYGATGLKAQEINKLMPEMSEKISKQTQTLNNDIGETLAKLKDDPHVRQMRDAVENYQAKITDPAATSGDLFNAAQDFKQQLQEWGKYNKNFVALGERRFRDTAKELAFKFRTALEDSSTWGKAAERQGVINKAFTEYLPTLKNFESKFTTEIAGERVIDPGKVQTFVNQAGKMSGAVKREMLGNFIEAAEKYKDVIGDSHATLGLDNPISRTSLTAAKSHMQELTAGAKLADALVKRGMANVTGDVLGAGVGGTIGGAMGAPGIGAIIGQHALGDFFSSILPAIAKPLLENSASSAALKNSVDYGLQVIKGEKLIHNGTRAIFKSTREVLPSKSIETSENSREKLEKRVAQLQQNPESLLSMGGETGHYLPDHSVAMTETAGRVMQYLANIKPAPVKLAPLDEEIEPSLEDRNAYDRALDIAEKPLVVLQHIKDGTLLPEDVKSLTAMYPGLYQKLSQSLSNQMIDFTSTGEPVPYELKQSLSLFLGQALDSTLSPAGIMAAQSTFFKAPPPEQQAPKKGNTEKLSKISDSYRTEDQAARARKDA